MKGKFLIFSLTTFSTIFANTADLDDLIETYINLINVPSACVSVCTKDTIIHKEAYGYKNLEDQTKATVQTLYPVGSISKSFTTMLFGMCSDDGIISFDDKVSDLIPFFKLNNQIVTDEITIRDYLSHQTGYGSHDTLWYNQRFSRGEIVQKLRYIPEIFPHRRTFFYQNIGYLVAAHALECVTSSTWEELIQERILNPLGMSETCMDIFEMQKRDDYAAGYIDLATANEHCHYIDPYTIAPSGGICSNLEEITRWTQFLLNKGEDLLKDQTFEEICTPQIVTNLIRKQNFGLDKLIQMESYGLGFFITSYQGKKLIFHSGNIQGFSSLIAFIPEDDIGVSIIINKDQSIAPFLMALSIIEKTLGLKEIDWVKRYSVFKDFEKNTAVAGKEHHDANRQKETSPSHNLADFTGTYSHPGYGDCEVVLIDGDLQATYNDIKFPLEHYHYDVFSALPDCEDLQARNVKFSFNANFLGDISNVSAIFESDIDPIVFHRRAGKKLFALSYLEQFTGWYSYYGVSFSVELQNGQIVVKAPGQPDYPLVPEKNKVFSIDPDLEGYSSYVVEFLEDEEGKINCIQLVQPSGSIFSAYKSEY